MRDEGYQGRCSAMLGGTELACDARYWVAMRGTKIAMRGTEIAMRSTKIAMRGTKIAMRGTKMR
eukprot:483498-Rhodomonas_salina.1